MRDLLFQILCPKLTNLIINVRLVNVLKLKKNESNVPFLFLSFEAPLAILQTGVMLHQEEECLHRDCPGGGREEHSGRPGQLRQGQHYSLIVHCGHSI